jgi:hypothetical protein
MDRDAFLAAAISALSTPAEIAQPSASELVNEAWHELQYDMPNPNQPQAKAFRSFLLQVCRGGVPVPDWILAAPSACQRLTVTVNSNEPDYTASGAGADEVRIRSIVS